MITFNCASCKFSLTRADDEAGQKVLCPQCGQKLRVPQPPPPPKDKTLLGQLQSPTAQQTLLGELPTQPATQAAASGPATVLTDDSTTSSGWFVNQNGRQTGPFTSTELKDMAQSCFLLPDDLVTKNGGTKWVPARQIKGLFPGLPVAASMPVLPPLPSPPSSLSSVTPNVVQNVPISAPPAPQPAQPVAQAANPFGGLVKLAQGLFICFVVGMILIAISSNMKPTTYDAPSPIRVRVNEPTIYPPSSSPPTPSTSEPAPTPQVGTITFAQFIDLPSKIVQGEGRQFPKRRIFYMLISVPGSFGDSTLIISVFPRGGSKWLTFSEENGLNPNNNTLSLKSVLNEAGIYKVRATSSRGGILAEGEVEIVD